MSRPLTIALAGDVMLGRLVNQTISQEGFAYPWGDLLPVLHSVDLFLINLECALTASTERWQNGQSKPFYFRADPTVAATLHLGRVDFATLANNHAGDYGTPGLLETVEVLDRAGIAHAGAGIDLPSAQAPARLLADGLRVAVVAFADHPRAWAATLTGPGINYVPISTAPDNFAPVAQALAAARPQADLLIFTIHWGPNMRERPTPAFQQFARRVVEAGADVFWGHSAHLVQGIEFWHGRPILYDTGDFVDDYAVDPDLRNDLSALFLLRVAPGQVESVELLPVRIERMQVTLARGADRAWFARRLADLCAELGTQVEIGPERLRLLFPTARRQEGART